MRQKQSKNIGCRVSPLQYSMFDLIANTIGMKKTDLILNAVYKLATEHEDFHHDCSVLVESIRED